MARQDFLDGASVVERLNQLFTKHRDIIEANAETMKKLQDQYGKVPSDYLKAQREINTTLQAQAKTEQQLIKTSQEKEKLKQQEIRTTKTQIQLDTQKARIDEAASKRAAKEAADLKKAENLYSKVQAKVNQMTQTYNNLATKKELGLKLNTLEVKQLDNLEKRLNKYQNVLKTVDQNIGKYTRNVGNYSSGFNGLSNSINQLSREAPAFAVSMNTGFLALSNNIPSLFDEIGRLKEQNRALAESGEEPVSILKQLKDAAFSWQTLLSVGITVLTVYGQQIFEWAAELMNGKETIDAVSESTKAMDEIRVESLKSIVEEKLQLQGWLKTAQDVTLSYEEREIAADNILKQYPYWFENLGKEAIMNNEVKEAVEGVNAALLARAKSNAAVGRITENQAKIIDLEEVRLKQVQSLTQAEEKLRTIQRRSYAASNAENQAQSEAEALGKLQNIKAQIADTDEELASLNEINNRLTSYYIAETSKAIGLDDKAEKQKKEKIKDLERIGELNSKSSFESTISTLEKELSLIGKQNALYGILSFQLQVVKDAYEALYGAQKDNNEETEKTIKYGTADYYNDLISKLKAEQSAVADSTDQYKLYDNIIKSVQDQLDALTGKTEKATESTKELDAFLKNMSSGALSNMGLGSLNFFTELDENGKSTFTRLMEEADTFGEHAAVVFAGVGNVAKDVFNFMNQNAQAYFDNQYARLEREKDLALKYAGENTAGQEEINRQFEERKRQIRQREAKAQKELAIFNAVINIAQGVTASLAQGGPAGIAMAAVIAALGAVQIAMIASRPLPEYAMGTDNHAGGLMIVNDASGSKYQEMIKEPGKSPYILEGRNQVVNAPRGTKVLTAAKTERELERMLADNDIAPFSNVLHRNRGDVYVNNSGSGLTAADLDKVMSKYTSQKTFNIHIDKNGLKASWDTHTTKNVITDNLISTIIKTS